MSRHRFLVSGKAMLPASPSQAGASKSSEAGAPIFPARTVLIVEDNIFNLKLFDDLLQANGYITLKAIDGVQGLELARQHLPDVILLDICLPDISGLDVIQAIRESDVLKSIPVIAVTAFVSPEDEAVIRCAGCDDYVPKPIAAPDLLRLVRRHTGFRVVDGGRKGPEIDRNRP